MSTPSVDFDEPELCLVNLKGTTWFRRRPGGPDFGLDIFCLFSKSFAAPALYKLFVPGSADWLKVMFDYRGNLFLVAHYNQSQKVWPLWVHGGDYLPTLKTT